jgi:hypothetical protein
MSRTDDRRNIPLAVTNEVGSEGGSYADPTLQAETFEAPEAEPRAPGVGGAGSAAGSAIRRGEISRRSDAPRRLQRYPTEPPPREAGSRPSRVLSPGLVGTATGLAIGLLAACRRD